MISEAPCLEALQTSTDHTKANTHALLLPFPRPVRTKTLFTMTLLPLPTVVHRNPLPFASLK